MEPCYGPPLSRNRTQLKRKINNPFKFSPIRSFIRRILGCIQSILQILLRNFSSFVRENNDGSAVDKATLRKIKEQSISTNPFVFQTTKRHAEQSILDDFLDMIHTTDWFVVVTHLPDGKSQPSLLETQETNFLNFGSPRSAPTAHTAHITQTNPRSYTSLTGLYHYRQTMPKNTYIQQQPLKFRRNNEDGSQSELFCGGTKSHCTEALHNEFSGSNMHQYLHPGYGHQRVKDVHGPHLFIGPENILVSLHFDRYNINADVNDAANTTGERTWSTGWPGRKWRTACDVDPGRHNLYVQLTGKKLWMLFPPILDPELEKKVYRPLVSSRTHPHVSSIRTLIVEQTNLPTSERASDDLSPQMAQGFPEFSRHAWDKRVEIVLNAGESLHIPPRWWHTTKSLERGIGVNWWFSLECTDRLLEP